MYSEVIVIVVVLAASTQDSCAQQSSSVYGLTEEKSIHFHEILNNQETSRSRVINGFEPIFDLLEVLSIRRKYNLQYGNLDISASIAAGLANSQIASDHGFNSLSDGTCAAAEAGRVAARQDFAHAYASIETAIRLAASGNFTDVRTDFEPFFVAAKAFIGTFIGRLFNTFRACINTNNPNVLAAVKERETESTAGMYRANEAVFDAIKVCAAETSIQSSAPGIATSIDKYRRRAALALSQSVEHGYIPFRSLYISTQLNKPELGSNLTSNQHAHVLSDTNYLTAADLMFDFIRSNLISVQLGLSDSCKGDPSVIDAAEVKAVEYYKTGLRSLLQSVPTNNPATTSVIQTVTEFFNTFPVTGAHAYFTGIRLALGQQGSSYSETLSQIQTTEDGLQAIFPNLISNMFTLIQLGSGNVLGIANFQAITNQAGHDYVENVFKGVKILAKACHGVKPVSQEDFADLETAKNGVAAAARNLNSNVSGGHVSVIKTLSVIPVVTTPVARPTNLLNLNLGLGLNLG